MGADKEKLNYQLWLKLDVYLQLSSVEDSGWTGGRNQTFPKYGF